MLPANPVDVADPPILTGGSAPPKGPETDFVVMYTRADHIFWGAKDSDFVFLGRRGSWTLYEGKAVSFSDEASAVDAALKKRSRLAQQRWCCLEVMRREITRVGEFMWMRLSPAAAWVAIAR